MAALANNTMEGKALDAWLDGKAETTLLLNSNLNSFDINTDVSNQVVTLTGVVSSDVEKALAEELVASLSEVKEVDNKLNVKSTDSENIADTTVATLTDAKITTVVKTRLLMSEHVSGTGIEVDTDNNVVKLAGYVDSDAAHDLALAIANNTPDVTEVVDELEVKTK